MLKIHVRTSLNQCVFIALLHESQATVRIVKLVDFKRGLRLVVADLREFKLGKKVLSQRSEMVNSDFEGFKCVETRINKDFLIIIRSELIL
jgi:hypothetical protein